MREVKVPEKRPAFRVCAKFKSPKNARPFACARVSEKRPGFRVCARVRQVIGRSCTHSPTLPTHSPTLPTRTRANPSGTSDRHTGAHLLRLCFRIDKGYTHFYFWKIRLSRYTLRLVELFIWAYHDRQAQPSILSRVKKLLFSFSTNFFPANMHAGSQECTFPCSCVLESSLETLLESSVRRFSWVLFFRHAWLNLLSEHITAGRINQVSWPNRDS